MRALWRSPERMNMCIRVLIINDQDVVSLGLASILREEPDIEVMPQIVRTGQAVVGTIRATHPKVLVLDAKMSDFDLLCGLDMLNALFPQLPIIVVRACSHFVVPASRKGAAGCFLEKESLSHQLPMAVREVAAGNIWFSPKASQYLIHASMRPIELESSQWDVLRLMAQGRTPLYIASTLQRSLRTIYNTQVTIRDKLGVETNEQAILLAIREGYVPFELSADSYS